ISLKHFVNDWKLLVILAAIALSWFFLRRYIGAKAENLAQKEDLRDLTDIVERVRTQFERANLVHKVQFEAEFKACQDVWREANNTHQEFVRLFSLVFGKPTPLQRGTFISAQLAFADALEAGKPFMNQAVWKAFFEHENLPSSLEHYQNPICFFQFDYYAAIDEERFAVPIGRPYHVLRHHHSRLP